MMQLAAFAMGIMALLLIAIVRVDLLAAWERDLPADAANVFVVNIQPDQVAAVEARLAADGHDVPVYPMVRARLVAENGIALVSDDMSERQQRRLRHEYNLSWARDLPAGNEIVAGTWWGERGDTEEELSLEREWAEEYGYEPGDSLTFSIAGIERSATVTSIREVDWETFNVNFFALGSPRLLEGLPATFVTSFHTDEDFVSATSGWARAFPGIAALDVGAIIQRVKNLMDRASQAVEYVFFFTLLAGLCVLLAAVQSSQAERVREAAILRALGASHRQIRQQAILEFAILGALSGALAALFASLVAWGLSRFVFELPWSVNIWMWVIGIAGGAVGISLAGYLATRSVLDTPPLQALRHTG